MIRQCAWCLRLIDSAGERISQQPVTKLYEASHGMCGPCGALWMEQVLDSSDPPSHHEDDYREDRAPLYEDAPSRKKPKGQLMICKENPLKMQ